MQRATPPSPLSLTMLLPVIVCTAGVPLCNATLLCTRNTCPSLADRLGGRLANFTVNRFWKEKHFLFHTTYCSTHILFLPHIPLPVSSSFLSVCTAEPALFTLLVCLEGTINQKHSEQSVVLGKENNCSLQALTDAGLHCCGSS